MGTLFQSSLFRRLFQLSLWGVGLTSLYSLVIIAGPFVSIGGYHPLENFVVREMIVVIMTAALAGAGGIQFWRKRKSAAAIASSITGEESKQESDTAVLKDKMKDALETLKTASGSKADFLYDLPWYLMIGPPGAGKTTALVNSGLKFPLSRGATPAAVAGVAGTRYCDWWFTEDAVLIDTAGRYTTHDSDPRGDGESWRAFLDILKKNRPRQPINGVMVAISLEDLMTLSSAELEAHASAIRARLLELHDRLKVDFPVYALFTKADLVAGFVEFFGNLGEEGRRQVWGATFQTSDKTRNLVGEVPFEFDALIERLNIDLTDRLQEEPAPSTRVALFGFPAQMSALKRPIFDFLNAIFEPTRYHANATLRGFYFTSGTQEGTPIDQVIGALARSFGAEEVGGERYSGRGKSFFLTDLIRRVIIGEAAWVSTDRASVRRAMIIKGAAFAGIAVLSAAAVAAWWMSYSRNFALIKTTEAAVSDYQKVGGPIPKERVIADEDLRKILPLLQRLRQMPAGYGSRDTSTPVAATFGLSQRERLQSSGENAYHLGLERMFRPRLVRRIENHIEANLKNPSVVYEALKVYLMLGGVANVPFDRDLVIAWLRRDWETLYPGAGNAPGRKALEEHLLAMLDLEQGEPLVDLHGPLVKESQRTLGRLSISQRAYAVLKSQAQTAGLRDWVAAREGGPDMALVFEAAAGERLENVIVPAFFTYAGFHKAFLGKLPQIAEQMKKERWVLGEVGEQVALAEQYDRLSDDLLSLYSRDFIEAWRQALNKLRLRRLTADKPKYVALSAISAATSPFKQIIEAISDETRLTRERPGSKKGKDGEAAAAPDGALIGDRAPGANIEAAFRLVHLMVDAEGGRKPVDAVVAILAEINQSVTLAATNPSQVPQANAQLAAQLSNLKATAARMPPPFADMLRRAATDFETDAANLSGSIIMHALREQVTRPCQQLVTGKYPFDRGSRDDISLFDFGRVFGPSGILDKFFAQHLAPLTDTSKREWAWRPDNRTANVLNAALLRDFQRGADVREAFFQGGGTQPSFAVAVTPPVIRTAGITVKLEVNGAIVEAKDGGNTSPVSIPWPGAAAISRTAVTMTNEPVAAPPPAAESTLTPGTAQPAPQQTAAVQPVPVAGPPSVLERNGAFSLFRMLELGSPSRRGERILATFTVGGRDWAFQFAAGSGRNPLNLAALREFRCPTGT